MASLTGSSIASSYTSLLKLNGNTDTLVDGDGSNAIQVVDGDGTGSALYLNKDRLGIGGQPSEALDVTGNALITGSLGIGTSSPINQGSALHIYQNHASNNTFLTVESDGASASVFIDIDTASGRDGFIRFKEAGTDKASIFNDASADALVLTDGSNSNTVYIKSDSVGIGTESAQSKLHIGSRGSASALSPSGDGLIFDFYNGVNPYPRYGTIMSNSADTSEAKLSLWTTASSSTASEKLCIDGDGTADHKGNYIVNEPVSYTHLTLPTMFEV